MDAFQPGRRRRRRRRDRPEPGTHPAATGVIGVSEFTQLGLWMAATLAGLVTTALLARRPFFQALARRMGLAEEAGAPPAPKPTPQEALPMLAESIVGNSKAAVAAVFGPPRGAVVAGASPPSLTYWDADAWYYPMPKTGQFALAIEFRDDVAERVQFLQAPRVG